jgi:hypothetical protein
MNIIHFLLRIENSQPFRVLPVCSEIKAGPRLIAASVTKERRAFIELRSVRTGPDSLQRDAFRERQAAAKAV